MNLRDCDDYQSFLRTVSVADAVLADSDLGRKVHFAVKMRRLSYDGHRWLVHRRYFDDTFKLGWEPVVWLRHWLTEGVIELEQDYRPRPGHQPWELVMDLVLPCMLVFTGDWADPHYAHDRNLWNCNCAQMESK